MFNVSLIIVCFNLYAFLHIFSLYSSDPFHEGRGNILLLRGLGCSFVCMPLFRWKRHHSVCQRIQRCFIVDRVWVAIAEAQDNSRQSHHVLVLNPLVESSTKAMYWNGYLLKKQWLISMPWQYFIIFTFSHFFRHQFGHLHMIKLKWINEAVSVRQFHRV